MCVCVCVRACVREYFMSLARNSGRLTCVRHSSRKSSATHSYDDDDDDYYYNQ